MGLFRQAAQGEGLSLTVIPFSRPTRSFMSAGLWLQKASFHALAAGNSLSARFANSSDRWRFRLNTSGIESVALRFCQP